MKKKILLPLTTLGITVSSLPIIAVTSCSRTQKLTARDLAKQCISLLAMKSSTNQKNITVVDALKQVDIIIENLENEDAIKIEDEKSDKELFAIKQNITFTTKDGGINIKFTLYYNDVTTEYKEKKKKSEVKSCMEGVCVLQDKTERAFEAVMEHEASSKKTEYETKFKLFRTGSIVDYDQFTYEKEVEKSEVEYKYKYKTVTSGVESEYEIKIELEDKKFVVKLDFEEGGEEVEHKLKRIVYDNNVYFYEHNKKTSVEKVYKRVVDKTTGEVTYEEL